MTNGRQQASFASDDSDSRTRDSGLTVPRASLTGLEPFDRNLFAGFESMKVLTYTASLRMIVGLLRDFEYREFECVFGHSGILPADVSDILAFQAVVEEQLGKAFIAVSTSDQTRSAMYDRVAQDTARFFVVKDKIAHAKIYLLEREGLRRVVVGSANLSETAFSGRQAETLILFDNDDGAWDHCSKQYESVRDVATSRLSPRESPIPAEFIPIEEVPALRDVDQTQSDVRIYVPPDTPEETEISLPTVLQTMVKVAAPIRKALTEVRPDRTGTVSITPRIVRQSITIARSRPSDDDQTEVYLSYDGRQFVLSGEVIDLEADPEEVRQDVGR